MTLPPDRPHRPLRACAAAIVSGALAAPALAAVRIGAILSPTGPGAAPGIPAEKTATLRPAEIGGRTRSQAMVRIETGAWKLLA